MTIEEHLEHIDSLLEKLCGLVEVMTDMQKDAEDNTEKCIKDDCIDSMSLYDTDLLPKTRNALLRRGFKTVGQVRSLSERQLLGIPHIGSCAINDIKSTLAEYGLELPRMDYRG